MFYINFFCTLLILILILNVKSKEKINLSNNIYWIIFCAFFILGFCLRVYKFSQIPAGINQDEAMAAVEAKSLLEYGTDRFGMRYPVYFTGWIYSQMNVLMSYIMILPIKLFGFNIFAVRLPNLFFSIIGMIFLFILSKDMFGKIPALIIFNFCTINPWHIMQSRWALEANLLPHIFIIAIYFFYRGLKNSKKIFIYLSMFFFAMCMYCYGISFYTVNLFLLICAIYIYTKKILSLKEIIYCFLIYLLFSWPIYAVMFINIFDIDTIRTPWFTIPYFPYQCRQKDILFFCDNPILQLKMNFVSLLKFLFQICLSTSSNINDFGAIYICSVPLLFLGIIYACKNFRTEFFIVLTNFFIGIFAALITSDIDLCLNRANFIFYSMIILIGIGINNLINKKNFYVLFVIYYMMTATFCSIYFNEYKNYIAEVFYYDFVEVLEYTKKNNYEQIFITSNTQYRNSADVSEIITLFCHNIDSKYFRGQKKINSKIYAEKYFYKDFLRNHAIPKKNTVYIIRDFELRKQYLKKFKVKKFGRFYLMKSK